MTEQNNEVNTELERKRTKIVLLDDSINDIDRYLAKNREVYAKYPHVHAILTCEYGDRRREQYELQREIRSLERKSA